MHKAPVTNLGLFQLIKKQTSLGTRYTPDKERIFTMPTQEFLTLLFDAIALSFITIATLDFTAGLMPLMPRSKMPLVSPSQLNLFDLKPLPLPLLPDPWTLPIDEIAEVTAQPQETAQIEQKPVLLLLPPANEISIQTPLATTAKLKLVKFLSHIDIDKLQLRPARKIAKVLNLAQKINGRDQTLSFLRNQIKVKLQQLETLSVETLEVLREVLAS